MELIPGNEGVMVCRHVAGHDCWVLRDKPATEEHPLACRCSSLPAFDNVKLPTRASIPMHHKYSSLRYLIEGHIVGDGCELRNLMLDRAENAWLGQCKDQPNTGRG